ncbi:hypothetical protein DHW03_14735 [Pedobacter yonginense]|uniref:Streptomycin biosynthesis protein StrF domain-containing protein n=1 Tax=Pedobacter yonginense TaxID=651869 RepID=A0A317EMX5_9SPHI|nr:glycosyltransferase [Pedobacter yonginense]PWS27243.1 hypothetical protein DHW03_14735 [Pedobacter yonginense]
MISIIIASLSEQLLFHVKQNIKQTIGVECEIIAFDNSDGSKGLCEIYNLGVQKSKFDLLCFMHEDVDIKTENWGDIVNRAFKQNPKLGLLGIAGTTYKALSPSGWHCNATDVERTNIIQTFKFAEKEKIHHLKNPLNEVFSNVACVDGVWFCTKKDIANRFPFDEKTFKHFHGYDLDFSMQVYQNYDINVRFDILLHHFSEGKFDRKWIEEILKFHNKWDKSLPINIRGFDKEEQLSVEKRTFKDFIRKALTYGIPKLILFKTIWKTQGIKKISFLLLLKLTTYLSLNRKS